jgi:hypothetical protein
LHPAEFGSFVAIVNRPETAGRWRLALVGCGKHDEPHRARAADPRRQSQHYQGQFCERTDRAAKKTPGKIDYGAPGPGPSDSGVGTSSVIWPVAILMTWTALPVTSAGNARLWGLGALLTSLKLVLNIFLKLSE